MPKKQSSVFFFFGFWVDFERYCKLVWVFGLSVRDYEYRYTLASSTVQAIIILRFDTRKSHTDTTGAGTGTFRYYKV